MFVAKDESNSGGGVLSPATLMKNRTRHVGALWKAACEGVQLATNPTTVSLVSTTETRATL